MSTEAELPSYYQLRDLLQRPELLHPPPVVVPRLAWEGRITLLAAPEKPGKSTLLGQAVAAVAQGHDFLGDPVEQGVTLW
jgi:RecA-family ATPase